MSRSLLLGLVVLAGLLLALGALDVIPLGLGGDADPESDGDGGALLTQESGAGEGATLKGLGDGKAKEREPGERVVPAAPPLPAEVRGSTKNGGSVRGRVVRQDGGVPFPGVRVTLSRPDSIIHYLGAKANGRFDQLEARTGADGRFAFLDVTPSKGYVVRAHHEGFAVACSADDLDLRGRGALDVGDLAMGGGAMITGRVVDQGRRPTPNVRVAVTWRISNPLSVILADPDTAPEIERETVTAADGTFRLEKLHASPKTIIVVARTGAAQVVRSVSLAGGQVKAIDDIVLPGEGVLGGTVLWEDGTPVGAARVFAAPRMQAAVRPTVTDEQGRFRLTWLPEGRNYVIGVLVPGLPVSLTMGLTLGDDDVRVVLGMPGRLRGTVVDAQGRPLTRLAVQLDSETPSEDTMMNFMIEQVKRGLGPTPFESDEGTFDLPRVEAGRYSVSVTAPGFPPVKQTGIVVVSGETTEVRIEVPRGNLARGTVLRAGGDPLEGARIHVIEGGVPADVSGPGLGAYVYGRDPDAVSRGDGSFALPPLTPGRYDLIATHDDVLAGVERGVDLRGGDVSDVRIRMPPSGTVRGTLLDEAGRPAKGERVYVLYRNGIVRTARTDEAGTFELGGLPIGRCLVRWLSLRDTATYRRYFRGGDVERREKGYDELRTEGEEREVTDGGVVGVALRLPPRTKVTGYYRIGGEPPPDGNRRFYVTVAGGGHWIDVDVAPDGSFETHLQGGAYQVYGPAAGNRWEAQAVEIPSAPTHVLDIER